MYDIIIQGGIIIDGTGKERFRADVGIVGDKIEKIGDLSREKSKKYIDAWGRFVTPGFIDILNHSDSFWTLFTVPKQESLVFQGITTILGGNCGSSLAPLIKGEMINSIQKWADIKEVNVNWMKMGEFLEELEKRKLGVNFATLVGHSTLRRGLLGDESRNSTESEIKIMSYLLEEALDEGAFGMSSGLVYTHAGKTDYNELLTLVDIVKNRNALYSVHLKNEGLNLLASVNDVIRLARDTEVNMEISHFKVMGRKNWPSLRKAVHMLENLQENDININFDTYVYTITNPVLYILLPNWATEGGKSQMLSRLKDEAVRKKIIKEMQQESYDYDKVIIAISPVDRTFLGKKISDIALNENISVEEAIINILLASEGKIIAFIENLSEENIDFKIKHNMSIISTGGTGYNIEYRSRGFLIHPKCFGGISRFLSYYIRDKKILTWEQAIQKITEKPAKKIGLSKRGILKEKMFADVVIFDPDNLKDNSSFLNAYQYASGINHVIINGEHIIENGEHKNILAGKVLRKNQ